MVNADEKRLLEKIQEGDKKSFSVIFSQFYKDLVLFAGTFTKDQAVSEEIVQDVFIKFWELRHYMHVNISVKSYLLKATQNKSLDWLKHQKVIDKYNNANPYNSILSENNTDNYILYSELQIQIEKALATLPHEISEAFQLNRFKGLKYHEIAEKQHVSVRTIEDRIGKALQLLRTVLKDYLLLLSLFFANIFS